MTAIFVTNFYGQLRLGREAQNEMEMSKQIYIYCFFK